MSVDANGNNPQAAEQVAAVQPPIEIEDYQAAVEQTPSSLDAELDALIQSQSKASKELADVPEPREAAENSSRNEAVQQDHVEGARNDIADAYDETSFGRHGRTESNVADLLKAHSATILSRLPGERRHGRTDDADDIATADSKDPIFDDPSMRIQSHNGINPLDYVVQPKRDEEGRIIITPGLTVINRHIIDKIAYENAKRSPENRLEIPQPIYADLPPTISADRTLYGRDFSLDMKQKAHGQLKAVRDKEPDTVRLPKSENSVENLLDPSYKPVTEPGRLRTLAAKAGHHIRRLAGRQRAAHT